MKPEQRHGFLVLTAINTDDGAADSETFRVNATAVDQGDGGPVERFHVTDAAGDDYMITSHTAGSILPEVRPYRELVQALIAADEPCPAYNCSVSLLGHLIASLTADQVELVRELDPSVSEGT